MIPAWKAWQTETVALLTVVVGVVRACALVGKPRSTHHRDVAPKPRMHGPHPKPRHPAELSCEERAAIITLLTSPRYANVSVMQAWASELDEGRYWASARTMHRVLAAEQLGGDRRRQATHPPRKIPELVATNSGEVWSWDITKMRGPGKGVWFHAYVVIDIFSRYLLGWRIETIEDGALAAELVVDIVAEQGRPPGYLHADGGAAMTSKPLASLLSDLDVRRSHNRPRTSNDNPYSEAQFKTMKYAYDYPDRFATIGEARTWMAGFAAWYNHEHYHSGIGWHTPASVHYGTADDVREARQLVLNQAFREHPERFHRRPAAPPLPTRAAINDPARRDSVPQQLPETPTSHLI